MTKFLTALSAAFLAVALQGLPASAQSRERILDFHSEIWVNSDASMRVRETITVVSAGRDIKRGIFRDFPTTYKSPRGTRFVVGFNIQEIKRDGQREAYHTERQSNGVRVYVGDADVFIPNGRHVYQISYKTDRQLGFYDDFDELFWNVTGNGWIFPIERARATIHLPDGATVLSRASYTGAFGEQGRDFVYTEQTGSTLGVETNRTLNPGEGLSVAVSWPLGFVDRPTKAEQAGNFISDNLATFAGLVGLALLLTYYLIVWTKVGRDPGRSAIYPRYEPPEALSPAGARYVSQMGFDDKTFTAAIVSLAVKGFLTIEEDLDGDYTLTKTGRATRLSRGERAVTLKLFPGSRRNIHLKQKSHQDLRKAKKALQKALRTEFEKVYFVRNKKYFTPGIGLTIFAMILMVATSPEPAITGFVSVWLGGWTVGVYHMVRQIVRGWRAVIHSAGVMAQAGALVGALPITLFSAPFLGGELVGLWMYSTAAGIGAAVILVLLQIVNMLFYHILKSPTQLGRRALDEIEGFKDYLSIAEKDRMNLLNPPDQTPELFERFLPYALALGVEQQWAEQFSTVLTQAADQATMRDGHYSPTWYNGRSFNNGFSDCTSRLSSGFGSAISAASVAPASSGGSGGGGFSSGGGSSGGGGGGGGGGGW